MELTQEKLAEKLCLSTRNYQKLERGVHRPSAITIILFLYLLSDQEIISFIHSFGQMVEKAHSQEVPDHADKNTVYTHEKADNCCSPRDF